MKQQNYDKKLDEIAETKYSIVSRAENLAKAMAGDLFDVGSKFLSLNHRIALWSNKTFGDETQRGPIGPLKHLAKEALEAVASPNNMSEYADCLILILDATRRTGIKLEELIDAAHRKMGANEQRKWPKPTSDEPVEHIRTGE